MKKYLSCSILTLFLCWIGLYAWRFLGGDRTTASWQEGTAIPQKPLREVVDCALQRTVPSGLTRAKARATLDFLGDELADGMESYGMSSDVERAHFLAQVMHESGNFTLMIEYAPGPTWRDDAVFDAGSSSWRCDGYLRAVNSDKKYFDGEHSYKAAFRGRGFIQLTFCHNYMRFFYHFLTRQQNLTNLEVDKFIYTHGGEDKELEERFCGTEELESIAEGFRRDGIRITREFAIDFESVLDRLSLPCEWDPVIASSIPSMSIQGVKFLAESSLWFWNEECRERYPNAVGDPSDRAVGIISGCVNGARRVYRRFDETWCNDGRPHASRMENFLDEVGTREEKDRRRTIIRSYCRRLHNFNVLMSCS